MPTQRLSFGYDYAGRRIRKKVEDHHEGEFVERYTLFFAYDGWNLAAEWTKSGIPIRGYTWGSDLSGGEATGGIGGLLWINQLPEAKQFSVAYDGNGNVTNLFDMADGTKAASYEYRPFGELIRSTGLFAKVNPIHRFARQHLRDDGCLCI